MDEDVDFCTCAVDLTRADSDGGVVVNYKGGLGYGYGERVVSGWVCVFLLYAWGIGS